MSRREITIEFQPQSELLWMRELVAHPQVRSVLDEGWAIDDFEVLADKRWKLEFVPRHAQKA